MKNMPMVRRLKIANTLNMNLELMLKNQQRRNGDVMTKIVAIIPRIIRLRDAALYLGVDKNRFNAEVRPHLQEYSIGTQGIAFDRLDLDAYAEEHILRNGQKRVEIKKEGETCQNMRLAYTNRSKVKSGTSTKGSKDSEGFAKALVLVRSEKPKDI